MAQYAIYEHPKRPRRLVKRGWRWPTFLLTGLCLIFTGLWLPAAGFLLLAILVGKYGGKSEEAELLRLGYLEVATVDAGSKSEAEAHFLRSRHAATPPAEAERQPPTP